MQTLYIGIDDTDNLNTRGTGYRARQLLSELSDRTLAEPVGITRHQLLFDDRVPYTSHNSSACIAISTRQSLQEIASCCREFLLRIAAEGSDVGLCVTQADQAGCASEFGKKAKTDLVYQEEARQLALQQHIFLEGLTGDHQGIIGALSAVGLYADGDDGRYIWSRGLREHADHVVTLSELQTLSNLDRVALEDETELQDPQAKIELGAWPRAVRLHHQSVLLVEHCHGHRYKVLHKDRIKALRP